MSTADAHALLVRLLGGIAPEVDLDDLDPDAPLQDALDLDSMDFVNLVAAVEQETGRTVPARDYPFLSTLSGFVTYLSTA